MDDSVRETLDARLSIIEDMRMGMRRTGTRFGGRGRDGGDGSEGNFGGPARRKPVDGSNGRPGRLWGLGLLVRLVRYLVVYPIWHDEAFLAVNFLDRGYRDLLRPLDYCAGQPHPLPLDRAHGRPSARLFGMVAPIVSRGLRAGQRDCCSGTWPRGCSGASRSLLAVGSLRPRFIRSATPRRSSRMRRTCWRR